MKLFSGKMLETLLIEQRRYSEGLLPEIIKRLINCSGAEVDRLRIPDGDDVWAPGYDGIVSAKVESRYITGFARHAKGLSFSWHFLTMDRYQKEILRFSVQVEKCQNGRMR